MWMFKTDDGKVQLDRDALLNQWDYWREQIAAGDESSAPRDWFESVLDMIEEKD